MDGVAVDSDGKIYLTTTGNLNAPGIAAADEDIVVFTPTSLGWATAGTFSPTLYFDGSAIGYWGDIKAFELP